MPGTIKAQYGGGDAPAAPSEGEIANVFSVPTYPDGSPVDPREIKYLIETSSLEDQLESIVAAKIVDDKITADPPTIEELQEVQPITVEPTPPLTGGSHTPISGETRDKLLKSVALYTLREKRLKAGLPTRYKEDQEAYDKSHGRRVKGSTKSNTQFTNEHFSANVVSYAGQVEYDGLPVNIPSANKPTSLQVYIKSLPINWKDGRGGIVFNDPTIQNKSAPMIPTSRGGVSSLSVFSQMMYILPANTVKIVVVPPINGNMGQWRRILSLLLLEKILTEKGATLAVQQNTVIVFTAPFYSEAAEIELAYEYLAIKNANSTRVFALSDPTNRGYETAVKLNLQAGLNTWLFALTEPSYIVYPYPHMESNGLFISNRTTAGLPPPANSALSSKLSTYTTSPYYGKAATIIYKVNDAGNSQVNGYMQVISAISDELHPPIENDKNMDLTKMHQTADSITIIVTQPLIKSKQAGDTVLFMHSVEANDDPRQVDEIMVNLQGNYYDIRKDDAYRNNVFDNWMNRIYTRDEAHLLNELNLRPYLLTKIFGDRWVEEVAKFLKNIGLSRCFVDETIMTRRECQESRSFIKKVMEYYAVNDITDESIQKAEANAFKVQAEMIAEQVGSEVAATTQLKGDIQHVPVNAAALDKIPQYFTDIKNNKTIFYFNMVDKSNTVTMHKSALDGTPTGDAAIAAIQAKLEDLKKENPAYNFVL